jgi:hypothetical protein
VQAATIEKWAIGDQTPGKNNNTLPHCHFPRVVYDSRHGQKIILQGCAGFVPQQPLMMGH